MHLLTYWIWMSVMLLETTLAHSGYDFPYCFVDGSEHAYHHSHYQNNYGKILFITKYGNQGSWFTIWDKLMGTDKEWKKYMQRKKLKKESEKKEE